MKSAIVHPVNELNSATRTRNPDTKQSVTGIYMYMTRIVFEETWRKYKFDRFSGVSNNGEKGI
jgi:hypothetical protein